MSEGSQLRTWCRASLAPCGLAVPKSVPSHPKASHGSVSLQNKDGSYTGFIKVQLKLVRPVSVPASKKPPTLQDARRGPGRSSAVRRRTSFYLPKDAVKHLHVLSRTPAREVIEALLRKFLVVDDPRKFALFERAERHSQGGPRLTPCEGARAGRGGRAWLIAPPPASSVPPEAVGRGAAPAPAAPCGAQ